MCCSMESFDPDIFEACQNHPFNECVGYKISGYKTNCKKLETIVEDVSGLRFGGICVPIGIRCINDDSCPVLSALRNILISSYCDYYDNLCKYNL